MKLKSIAVAALVAATGFALWAKESGTPRPPPHFQVDSTPIDRNADLKVSFAPVVKRVERSVVYISSTKHVRVNGNLNQLFQDPMFRRFFGPMMPGQGGGGGSPSFERQESLGSGVVVSPNGYILTNNHVVEGADEVKVRIGEISKEYPAKVIGRDAEADVAVLKIEATGLTAATLGDSDQLQVGDTVLAIGDPFGIGMTVTHGIISALGRHDLNIENFEDFIQTDAPINPGNSGGALLDTRGRVIGINTAILSHSGGSNGVGFAIPINLVRSIAQQLILHGKVSRGLLGVVLQQLTPDLAEQFGTTSGALVTDVRPGSPAEKAGLQSGDVITQLNGKPVEDYQTLSFAISELAPGTVVHLGYLRNGKLQHVAVTLGDRADANLNGNGDNAAEPGSDQGVLNGVSVTDITPQLRDELHIPVEISGCIISDVAADSASASILQKGDVILDLDQQPVHNAEEAIKLSAHIKGPKVLVHFWRDGAKHYDVVDESLAPAPQPQQPGGGSDRQQMPDSGGDNGDSGN